MKKIITLALTVLAVGATMATPATAATAPIPKGFLLYEKEAAKKPALAESSWKVSDSARVRLATNPCDRATLARTGRTAARTVTYTSVPDFQRVEQVILYRSKKAAASAVAQVRSALTACRSQTTAGSSYRYASWRLTGLGDEALRISGQVYQGRRAAIGGERTVLVRKGNAVLIYLVGGEYSKPAKSDWSAQSRDARRMTAKVCRIAAC